MLRFIMGIEIISIKYCPVIQTFSANSTFGYSNKQRLFGYVEVASSDRQFGYGEIYCGSYISPKVIDVIIETIFFTIRGKNIDKPENFINLTKIPFVSDGGLYESVLGGVDIAIWDCYLKLQNLTLSEYLNITRTFNPSIYLSSGSNYMNSSEIASECKKISNDFQGYKMRVGLNKWDQDLDRVRSARSNLPPNCVLMVDAIMSSINMPWSYQTAKNNLQQLLDQDIYWFEEPLSSSNFRENSNLCSEFPFKIALGESLVSLLELKTLAKMRFLGAIQLDATHQGGITKLIMFMRDLMDFSGLVSMHVWGSQLSFNVNYQIAKIFPQITWVEKPNYKSNIDNIIGSTIEDKNLVGFSNLNSDILNSLTNSVIPGRLGLYNAN